MPPLTLIAWAFTFLTWVVAAHTVTAQDPVDTPAEDAPSSPVDAQPTPPDTPSAIEPTGWLLLPRVGEYRRQPLHVDPIEAAVARGDWSPPSAGDTVPLKGERKASWRADDGPRRLDLVGGYAYAEFESADDTVYLLEAPGVAAVCVNGEWLPGDPYGVGWFRPPVRVAKGKNWLLAHLANPAASPRLVSPPSELVLVSDRLVAPDLPAGATGASPLRCSIPIINASERPQAGLRIRAQLGAAEATESDVRWLDGLLVGAVEFTVAGGGESREAGERVALRVELLASDTDEPLATAESQLSVVGPETNTKRTFRSQIDGSVQSFAVKRPGSEGATAVILALHDAGQTAAECLDQYPRRDDAWIVAPAGRGRWGFDWEDWSRRDALEALDAFLAESEAAGRAIDADRIFIAGRGMGGHGALRIATLDPDRFAAVEMIDPWISFFTQGRAVAPAEGALPIEEVLTRQASSNDPLRVLPNLSGLGVSLAHTGASGVGPEESRYLRERLGDFHRDFVYKEHDGESKAPDEAAHARRVDWLLGHQRVDPESRGRVAFSTPDVGVAATRGWVTLLSPARQGDIAGVEVERDVENGRVTGTTNNVARLRLALAAFPDDKDVLVRLDGGRPVKFRPGRTGRELVVARGDTGAWRRVPDISRSNGPLAQLFKSPQRSGGLKNAFANRPLLVYGTSGSKAEQSWAAAKARYDAHLYLYRGAGSLEVRPDTEFQPRRGARQDRSCVLYGNSNTNSAFSVLRQEAFLRRARALRVDAGRAWLGRRPEAGDDLAVLAVRPRLGDREACVAVIGGTGEVGMRMTTRLRYFWAGVAYPDCLMFGPKALVEADGPRDVRAAGYFDQDWGVSDGDVVWRDLAI